MSVVKQSFKYHLTPKRLAQIITTEKSIDQALQIFHNYTSAHNYYTYKAIIQRLCRARAFEAVDTLFTKLAKTNNNCGEFLYMIVIKYYGIASKPDLALKTFLWLSKEFRAQTSVKSFNTLLNALIENKEFDLVHVLFKNCVAKFNVLPNVVTCNLLIKALCKKGDVEGAVRIMGEFPEMGMVPNVITYSTVLSGFAARGDMVCAKRVFDEMGSRGCLPDVTTYTILMDGYVKLGRFVDAIKVMDEMEEAELKPSLVTYVVMIDGFCKEKKAGEAMNLLEDMLENECIPSSTLCCKVIDLLCEEGKVKDACKIWKKMMIYKCSPDDVVLCTLIHWLCKEGKVREARSLFNVFERVSVASLLTYNTLIAGMCENGELCEAGRLWDDMMEKGLEPNAFTYNMLLKGMCKGGNPKGGIRILEEMLDKGCLLNKFTFSVLLKALQKSGCEAEIPGLLYLIASKGFISDIEKLEIGTDHWASSVTKIISDIKIPGVALDKVLRDNIIYKKLFCC